MLIKKSLSSYRTIKKNDANRVVTTLVKPGAILIFIIVILTVFNLKFWRLNETTITMQKYWNSNSKKKSELRPSCINELI